MKYIAEGLGPVTLTRSHFVGSGGQAQIFARDDTAFKIYDDPTKLPPPSKLDELTQLTHPAIISPERRLLDDQGSPVGYTMRFIREAFPLMRLYARSFRDREGATPDILLELFEKARDGLAALHRAGFLMVDVSPMNLLVSRSLDAVYFIDVDSYQSPSHPATAITPSVLDPTLLVGQFSPLSDWFSFAVITFQAFIGIHPFKGRHPTLKSLDERMHHHISVYDPAVSIPRVCYPLDALPPHLDAWYRSLFVDQLRCAPPDASTIPTWTLHPSALSTGTPTLVDLVEVASASSPIRSVFEKGAHRALTTPRGVEIDGALRLRRELPHDALVAFTRNHRAILALRNDRGTVELTDIASGEPVPCTVGASDLMAYEGRLYARTREHILELVLTELGSQIVASSRVAAHILEHATRLFDGVALQNVLGHFAASLFPEPRKSVQHMLPELDGYRVLDARFDRTVLMVVARIDDRFDRFVFRFDPALKSYDCNIFRDCTAHDLNFVTLPTGVCAHLDDDDTLVLFPATAGAKGAKTVDDPALHGALRLQRYDGRVVFADGSRLLAIRTR